MTLEEKVDALAAKLDRLELIESHLLDLLLPQRKAFMRMPEVAPTSVVAEGVADLKTAVGALSSGLADLHVSLQELHEKVGAASFIAKHAESGE